MRYITIERTNGTYTLIFGGKKTSLWTEGEAEQLHTLLGQLNARKIEGGTACLAGVYALPSQFTPHLAIG